MVLQRSRLFLISDDNSEWMKRNGKVKYKFSFLSVMQKFLFPSE